MREIMLRSADAPESPWPSLIALLPHVFWALVLVGVLLWIGRDTLRELLRRVDKVSVAGVELELRDDLEAAAAARGQPIGNDAISKAARRLAASTSLTMGARLLWVDDEPAGIVNESRLFEQAGADITRVPTSAEAFAKLDMANYDLVLSDINRGGDDKAGIHFAEALAVRQNAPPLIFYVGTAKRPCPADAFGITDRPDELIHLVLDVLARLRS
jgi:CheY-like chemotaxis protein